MVIVGAFYVQFFIMSRIKINQVEVCFRIFIGFDISNPFWANITLNSEIMKLTIYKLSSVN